MDHHPAPVWRRRLIPLLLIAALAALLVWLVALWPTGFRPSAPDGSSTDPEFAATAAHRQLGLAATPTGGDFRLTGATGPLALADLRGKVVLLYFGYTWCPDICPTNLALIALALRGLTPTELAGVQAVFVSVDPARDTAARLAEYTAYFHPQVLGVTGSEAEVARVAARYGAAYARSEQADSAMGYAVDHSAHTYVIDPAGRLVETLDHATPADAIQAVIRRHLPAGSPL